MTLLEEEEEKQKRVLLAVSVFGFRFSHLVFGGPGMDLVLLGKGIEY